MKQTNKKRQWKWKWTPCKKCLLRNKYEITLFKIHDFIS